MMNASDSMQPPASGNKTDDAATEGREADKRQGRAWELRDDAIGYREAFDQIDDVISWHAIDGAEVALAETGRRLRGKALYSDVVYAGMVIDALQAIITVGSIISREKDHAVADVFSAHDLVDPEELATLRTKASELDELEKNDPEMVDPAEYAELKRKAAELDALKAERAPKTRRRGLRVVPKSKRGSRHAA